MRISGLLLGFSLALVLAGCGGQPSVRPDASPAHAPPVSGPVDRPAVDGPPPPQTIPADVHAVPDAVPRPEPLALRGNPDVYEVLGEQYHVLASSRGFEQSGIASWYGQKFQGSDTSSGEVYDMFGMTAAHKTLPLPSYVRVTNLENGREAVVRINDRGPFHEGRIIDLSYAAATRLGVIDRGTAPVRIVALEGGASAHVTDTPPSLYLQIGAYGEQSNAQRASDRLKALGFTDVFISTDDRPGALFRVQVGPYESNDQARLARQRLEANGFSVSALRY